jgi:lipocalin
MNKRMVLIAACLATLSAIVLVSAAQGKRPLRVVPEVDLARYAGQWYEIARFPNRFQKQCAGEVTAQYTLQPSGKISVLNRCRLENGKQIQAEGVARVAGKGQPNSILKVRFAPAFLSFIPQVWGETTGKESDECRFGNDLWGQENRSNWLPLTLTAGDGPLSAKSSARLSLKRRTGPYSERFAAWAADTDGTRGTGSGEFAVG